MQAFSVTILLLLSATISMSLDPGDLSISYRAQSLSTCGDRLCTELLCATNRIELTLNANKLQELIVDIPRIHLRDRTCTPFFYNSSNVYMKWSLGRDICGTELTVNDTHIVYSNQVFLPPDPTAIIYREEYIINVSCVYPINMTVSLPQILHPDMSITYINLSNNGKFAVRMSIYEDITYTTPYTENTVHLSTRSNLYVSVYIVDGENPDHFRLRMVNCYSTPSNNIYDPLRYNIISNSCPNPSDSTIRIIENGSSSKGKFYIQMFKFIGDYSVFYLHCDVYLCESACIPSCSGSRSSKDDLKAQGTLTIGPIRVSDISDDIGDGNGVGTPAGFSMVTILGLLLTKIFVF